VIAVPADGRLPPAGERRAERSPGRATSPSEDPAALSRRQQALQASIRGWRDQVERLTRERDEMRRELKAHRQRIEVLVQTRDRLAFDLESSNGEIEEIWQERFEFEQQANGLAESTGALTEENERLRRDLTAARGELLQERAVVQSLEEAVRASDAHGPGDTRRLRDLGRQVRVLYAENMALERKVVALEKLLPPEAAGSYALASEDDAPVGVAPAVESFYQDDPAGLWDEVCALLAKRYADMVRGRAAWDAADFVVLGTTAFGAALSLWFLWAPMRWMRGQRLVRDLRAYQRRTRELELREVEPETDAPPRGATNGNGSTAARSASPPTREADPVDAEEPSTLSPEAESPAVDAVDTGAPDYSSALPEWLDCDASEEEVQTDSMDAEAEGSEAGATDRELDEILDFGTTGEREIAVVQEAAPVPKPPPSPAASERTVCEDLGIGGKRDKPPLPETEHLGDPADAMEETSITEVISSLSDLDLAEIERAPTKPTMPKPVEESAAERTPRRTTDLLAELHEIIGQSFDKLER